MTEFFYLTHPEVVIDPLVPVPSWGLSARGLERSQMGAQAPWAQGLTRIWSSDEIKAQQTAQVFADRAGVAVDCHPGLGEIDHSAAGFIPEPEFSRIADACFAEPKTSVRGWETASLAQARCVAALRDVIAQCTDQDRVAVVGHGGVGSFLFAHLLGKQIGAEGTRAGGYGRVFAFRWPNQILLGWGDMETGPKKL